MSLRLSSICVVLIAIALSACSSATAPKVAFQPQAKQTIMRIALIEIPEPIQYSMIPGRSLSASPLMLFGALGGAIYGGIEVSRIQAASTRFTEAVLPYKPDISSSLLEQLETGLKRKGYEVVRVHQPPKTSDGKAYDLTKIEGTFDAVLIGTLNGGYSAGSNGVAPRLVASFTLVTKSGTEPLFADLYSYSTDKIGQMVQVVPDSKFIFESVDALYADIKLAVEGLKVGATKLAERILVDL
jgi:hypothetical protein